MPSAGEVAVQQFLAGGVRYFAGMVGSVTVPLVAAIARQPGARFLPVRHEHVAASLLDGAARLSGVPGVCLVHSASGSLAASLGIASAQRDSVPLIVVSGTQERRAYRRGAWQVLDVCALLRPIVKWQQRVEEPAEVPAAVRRALAEATGGRPGVVHLDLPYDVSSAPLDGPTAAIEGIGYRAPLYRPAPAAGDVARTADLLQHARRPVLLIGGGAVWSDAGPAVQALAERLGAPVVLGPSSRGLVPEDHPLCLGPSGVLGYPPASRAVREADLVIGIGSSFSDLQTYHWTLVEPGVPVVQVDLDPTEIGRHYPAAVGIVADARAFTEALLDATVDLAPDAERRAWAAGLREEIDRNRADFLASGNGPADRPQEAIGTPAATSPRDTVIAAGPADRVRPQEVLATLAATLPRNAIVAAGQGDHGFFAALLPVYEPRTSLASVGLGAMGCAFALALGARLAEPERPVVAILGDSEFMLQVQDLETAVRENLPVVAVIFNNFQLGSQRPRMAAAGALLGVEHGNPDFAALAEVFGAAGWHVDRPGAFGPALREALACGRPAIIDVRLDPSISPPRP